MKLIFDKRSALSDEYFPPAEGSAALPDFLCRDDDFAMPCLSETDVVRHYAGLADLNFSVDNNFYPLGSCTMKYNPRFTEKIAAIEGFTSVHPMSAFFRQYKELYQGSCEVIFDMQRLLCEITGMRAFTLAPAAGAHGELTGVMIAAAYHRSMGDKRTKIIVPDSSHGTNPASAAFCDYQVVVIPSGENGCMDIKAYEEAVDESTALVMLTCPNTLGIFNPSIDKICALAHDKGALVYYDGANLNAIMGKVRPGDVGFDIVHLNLHKTFATPHGGGGPGAGPVGVCEKLEKFLPVPRVIRENGLYSMCFDKKDSVGNVISFYGNFLVVLKAYAYILRQGKDGLIQVTETAVLNANYIKKKLSACYKMSHDGMCMHECVLSIADRDVTALDLAKYLIDNGIHPPTIYFPLIVKEAFMIEPTETESKETLDNFISVLVEADRLAKETPEKLKKTPETTANCRFDEALAARRPVVRWNNDPV